MGDTLFPEGTGYFAGSQCSLAAASGIFWGLSCISWARGAKLSLFPVPHQQARCVVSTETPETTPFSLFPPEILPSATSLSPPPLKPRKVWIVYSADHPLYVDV